MGNSASFKFPPKWLFWLLRFALVLSVVTVIDSCYIRLAESGLGCDDWPHCYGQFRYDENAQGINVLGSQGQEASYRLARVTHRLVASVLGVLVLAIYMLSWQAGNRAFLGRAVPFVLLLTTAILASIGIIHPQQPEPILTLANFFGGMLLVSLLWWLNLGLHSVVTVELEKLHYRLVHAVGALVIAQILLGGWASAHFAATGCESFLSCELSSVSTNEIVRSGMTINSLSIDASGRVMFDVRGQVIQWVHHLLALVLLVCVALLHQFFAGQYRPLRRASFALLAVYVAQFMLGLIALASDLPLLMIVVHNALALVMFVIVTTLFYQVRQFSIAPVTVRT